MAHEWHRGVLTTSSWHGLEDVGTMPDAEAMIAAGENCNAWPVNVRCESMVTSSGLAAPSTAIVGEYLHAMPRVLGVVGDRYRATSCEEWRSLVHAACLAGANPTGAFALCGGSRVLATFDVGGNGIRTKLVLADSFDGSLRLTAGTTSVRVVCANTLAASLRSDGEGMAKLLHTKSLEEKVGALRDAIGATIATGEKVRETFAAASRVQLDRDAAKRAFDLLFPESEEKAPPAVRARVEGVRNEARAAAALEINRVGQRGNLATLWNAATYLVDRRADGSFRDVRGEAGALDSLLFGARSKRISEIQRVVDLVMVDGTYRRVSVSEAMEHGVDARQVGRAVLADMLA